MTSSKQLEIKNLYSRHVDSQTKHSCATDHRQQSTRTLEMVFCVVAGCSIGQKNAVQNLFTEFQQLFHIMTETQELSSKRCSAWFSSIKRADIDTSASFYRVCSDHFVNGKYF